MSSWPYFTTPARSAWPGRGRVTGGAIGAGRVRPASPAPTYIVRCQFSQSLFGISSAIGAPVVTPWRTPLSGSARSDSISHAAAAAVAGLAAAQLGGDRVEVDREAGRHAFEDRDERLAVRLAGGEKSQHAAFILSENIAASGRAIARSAERSARASVLHRALLMQLVADRFAVHDDGRAFDLCDRRARHADRRQRRRRVGATAMDGALHDALRALRHRATATARRLRSRRRVVAVRGVGMRRCAAGRRRSHRRLRPRGAMASSLWSLERQQVARLASRCRRWPRPLASRAGQWLPIR